MAWHAGLFEAKSIQAWLFASGRLRDIVGGSELLESLTGPLLDDALRALDLSENDTIHFSRRAGGSLYAFARDGEHLRDFLALWSLLVQQRAPGLAFDSSLGHGNTPLDAFADARAGLRADNGRALPQRPAVPPPTARSPRTGQAAVTRDRGEPFDAGALARQQHATPDRSRLMDRVTPDGSGLSWRDWPLDLEAGTEQGFPFRDEDRTIALVHADGNGLGQLLMRAHATVASQPERFIEVFRALSDGIGEATTRAVQAAVAEVLIPARDAEGTARLPARPIVVGGDDVTVLVRADLALAFARSFQCAFERTSRLTMQRLHALDVRDLPDHLTAGAGVVFMKASQPFYMAADLVESLTLTAKRRARSASETPPPASIAFHHVTSALLDDHENTIRHELSHKVGEETWIHTLEAYGLRSGHGLPALDDLLALQALLQDERLARGPTRQLLGLIGLDPAQAHQRYRRWRQLLGDDASRRQLLDRFDDRMRNLLAGYEPGQLPWAQTLGDGPSVRRSPLGDAMALMSAGNTACPALPQEDAA
ncbi:hypothetical protein [Thioalkalivibrio sp. AKL10]|uniref:Cas10/Cmr2 second palm domain-containing protein n=1 Tax=Thioalkalivibrio sp. AKL10 TaxID=1158158 RepID=UPI00037BC725|nr:hypothetical protein [Thioalkalivibrio sp. AKL10]